MEKKFKRVADAPYQKLIWHCKVHQDVERHPLRRNSRCTANQSGSGRLFEDSACATVSDWLSNKHSQETAMLLWQPSDFGKGENCATLR